MNRFSKFFRKLIPTKRKEEKSVEHYRVDAPKPSERTRVTTRAIKSRGYAFSQYGRGAFKPLPRYIELGGNR